MFDFGWPGLDDRILDKVDHGWWESRCGNFRLRGFPCYNVKQVRDRYLPIIKELLSYDVAGIANHIAQRLTANWAVILVRDDKATTGVAHDFNQGRVAGL